MPPGGTSHKKDERCLRGGVSAARRPPSQRESSRSCALTSHLSPHLTLLSCDLSALNGPVSSGEVLPLTLLPRSTTPSPCPQALPRSRCPACPLDARSPLKVRRSCAASWRAPHSDAEGSCRPHECPRPRHQARQEPPAEVQAPRGEPSSHRVPPSPACHPIARVLTVHHFDPSPDPLLAVSQRRLAPTRRRGSAPAAHRPPPLRWRVGRTLSALPGI